MWDQLLTYWVYWSQLCEQLKTDSHLYVISSVWFIVYWFQGVVYSFLYVVYWFQEVVHWFLWFQLTWAVWERRQRKNDWMKKQREKQTRRLRDNCRKRDRLIKLHTDCYC